MAKRTERISISGPFFTHDPAKTFRQNARSMMRAISVEGERIVQAELEAGEPGRAIISRGVTPVRVSAHVMAGVPYTPNGGKASKRGDILVHVYVPNFGYSKNEAQALMAAYSRVEHETGAFRRARNALNRSRKANAEELLKGIA